MKTGVPDMDVWRLTRVSAVATVSLAAAACSQQPRLATTAIQPVSFTAQDRECMARAMYFESHRGADEGMVAVGTVVANRKDSGRYGSSICEVVGQKRQFAPGVMVRTMDGEAAERARRNAEKVLSGQRHPALKTAMFFHTAGYKFRYPNMHYVLVAGGNAFYEKREVQTAEDARENARSKALALAYARIDPTGASKRIQVASADSSATVSQPAVAAVAAPAPTQLASVAAPQPAAARSAQVQPVAAVSVPAKPAAEKTVVAVATPRPAHKPEAVRKSEPAPLAYASAAEPAAALKAITPTKRVLQPSKLTPALASAAPVAKVEPKSEPKSAEPVAAPEPSRSYAYNGEVAAAFAAFETR